MLDYEWGTQSSATAMFSGEDPSAQNRHFFDLYATQPNFGEDAAGGPGLVGSHNVVHFSAEDHLQLYHHQAGDGGGGQEANLMCSLYDDPRAYGGASSFAPGSHHQGVVPMLSLDPSAGFVVVPKSEPLVGGGVDFSGANLGLNLGGRTYFSSAEDDFVNRLYRRSRLVDAGSFNAPRCQAEGCTADLTVAKHYHRRHKVCDFHSKAATVLAAGLTQRFCQQCSRFHVLTEFDNGKRSCRRRLADHNRRRRKVPQPNHQETSSTTSAAHPQADDNNAAAHNSPSSDSLPRSPRRPPPDSSGSSVTVGASPPRMSIDSFGQRSYGYQLPPAAQSSPPPSHRAHDFSYL